VTARRSYVLRSAVTIRIFIVDDHPMVRLGFRELANEVPELEIVGEADGVGTALEALETITPDVALLDVRLPDGDGIELCREIRSRHPEIHCVIFTAYASSEAMVQSIVAGASGYLSKSAAGLEIVHALRAITEGVSLIDSAMIQSVLEMARAKPHEKEPALSAQQERVLKLIVEGLSNREIAERLDLAEKTVRNYVSVILDKLHLRSRTQAAVYRVTRREREDRPDT
jgi:two-component system response regulator DevR